MYCLGRTERGKSTLIKIISGVYQKDEGVLLLDGAEEAFSTTRKALEAGISVIHQELSVISDLTVAENILLGREIRYPNTRIINKKKMFEETEKLLKSLNINIDPRIYVRDLSLAERQMVEIVRAVSQNSKMVIMDEPTSCLSEREVSTLFDIINMLREKNVCVVYISHRMQEIRQIGDTISVLRDGKLIKTLKVAKSKENEWVALMIGREIKEFIHRDNVELGDVVLDVNNLTKKTILPKY